MYRLKIFFAFCVLVLFWGCASTTPPPVISTATNIPPVISTATAVPPTATVPPTETVPPSTATTAPTDTVIATATQQSINPSFATFTALAKMPTKTRGPTGTRQPTATPGPTTLLLDDRFDGQCKLSVVDDDGRTMGCTQGHYRLLKKKGNSTQWTYYRNIDVGDAIIEVDTQVVQPVDSFLYGLIFRVSKDGNRYYEFLLDAQGRYQLGYGARGQATQPLIGFTPAPGFQPNATNRLKVVAQGNEIAVYLNDQWLNTISNAELKRGSVGVLLGNLAPNAEVAFDNLRVTRLNRKINLPQGTLSSAPPPNPTQAPGASTACKLNPGEAGLLLINNYDVEVLLTIGGGEWGTHDYRTAAKTTLPIQFPSGRYTATLSVPGVGNFRFAQDRFNFEEGHCYDFRVP